MPRTQPGTLGIPATRAWHGCQQPGPKEERVPTLHRGSRGKLGGHLGPALMGEEADPGFQLQEELGTRTLTHTLPRPEVAAAVPSWLPMR